MRQDWDIDETGLDIDETGLDISHGTLTAPSYCSLLLHSLTSAVSIPALGALCPSTCREL
jgi:hypothetical protein